MAEPNVWWRRAAAFAVAAVTALAVVGLAAGPSGSSPAPACPNAVRHLGSIALAARGQLELIDLARCRVTVLRRVSAVDVRFSPDGRWLAYGRPARFVAVQSYPASPVVIPAHGGAARAPLGGGLVAWTWAPAGERLYGLTAGGSLVTATPAGGPETVATQLGAIPDGQDPPLGISPDGASAAVDVSRCAPTTAGELDTVDLRTGARAVALKESGHFFTLAGWSPDGRWLLFWDATMCSGSLAADGWPLEAVPASGGAPVRAVRSMLLYDDFLTWCGPDLIAAAGPDRQSNMGSKLLAIAPPAWRARTLQPARALSWVSPSCGPRGQLLAAAAGPNTDTTQFGLEHRAIWLLRAGSGQRVRRLTLPPAADLTDEAPRFSRDGQWILFVRSRLVPGGGFGGSRGTLELVRADGAGGAVPVVDFASGDFSYYDHFEWPYELDWYQPGGVGLPAGR
jgi:WD40-like Beta Propeller Repeat